MKLSDFDYYLPRSAIAQFPLKDRDASRMMVIKKEERSISHHLFKEIDEFLSPGDVCVVNNSRVIPARLWGTKESGGRVEILLLTKRGQERHAVVWDALIRPARRVKVGTILRFDDKGVAQIRERIDGKKWRVAFSSEMPFEEFLEKYGAVPLPPYIKRKDTAEDRERYQTIFASTPGSVAAPTAGFHFSPYILGKITARGVKVVEVTLHVGYRLTFWEKSPPGG